MSSDENRLEWWLPLPTLIINSNRQRPGGVHVVAYSEVEPLIEALKKYQSRDISCVSGADGAFNFNSDIADEALAKWEGRGK